MHTHIPPIPPTLSDTTFPHKHPFPHSNSFRIVHLCPSFGAVGPSLGAVALHVSHHLVRLLRLSQPAPPRIAGERCMGAGGLQPMATNWLGVDSPIRNTAGLGSQVPPCAHRPKPNSPRQSMSESGPLSSSLTETSRSRTIVVILLDLRARTSAADRSAPLPQPRHSRTSRAAVDVPTSRQSSVRCTPKAETNLLQSRPQSSRAVKIH